MFCQVMAEDEFEGDSEKQPYHTDDQSLAGVF
jgi:hypothetical protein